MRRLRRILHASDFSPASRAAFRIAIDAAKTQRSALIVAHVVHAPIAPGLPAKIRDQVSSLARAEAEKKLAPLVRSARAAGVRATSLILSGVLAHESIVAAARRLRADLIVIATRGRTGVPRMLMGSVASRVIATAPCPVLTIRR
jgi:nucleotide-binding universal stress UspA family protein